MSAPFMNVDASKVSILFITYNRSDILEQTFRSLKAWAGFAQTVTICSDDCSERQHQARIRAMGFDKVLIAEKNGGLGRNNNKGLKAVETDYVLMVQDDCELVDPCAIDRAIRILDEDPSIGMVRLMDDASHFALQKRQLGNFPYFVCDHHGPAYQALKQQGRRIRVYSDHAQLRRRSVHESLVGYYAEGVPMEYTEMDYEDRIDQQTSFFVAFLSDKENNFFVHQGTDASFRTSKLRYKIDDALVHMVNVVGLRKLPVYGLLRKGYHSVQDKLVRVGVLK
ncbi:MAG: glycosyltransferase family 2 protein [Aquabacterium sp.]